MASRLLMAAGVCFLTCGCASQEMTTSVQLEETTPKAAPTAASAMPSPPPIIPLVEERVSTEPLPHPAVPPPPPQELAKQIEPPPADEPPQHRAVVPFLLDIPFSFDQAKLRSDAIAMLEVNAMRLRETTGWNLVLEGHCDEIGTVAYNLVLGERRVNAVLEYLVRLGLPSSVIEGISYGKERPFCIEHNQECWQKNRVVRFKLQ